MREKVGSKNWPLFFIVLIGCVLRYIGLDWDHGFHLHPDERMLILVADKLHFFSNLNPNFFNYGSLPLYILKGFTQLSDYFLFTNVSNYNDMLYVGRGLSVAADSTVIVLVYLIAKRLFHVEKIAFFASFFYAITFFAIQNSHFFVVDVFLNLFCTLLIYLLLEHLVNPTLKRIFLISIVTAAALATKITAVIFLPIVIVGLFLTAKKHPLLPFYISIPMLLVFAQVTFVSHMLFMPYAYISYERFIGDTLLQTKMSSDPYIFPYTLQYVDTLPYWYFLKNIFIWGLGPVISILSLLGIYSVMKNLFQHFPLVVIPAQAKIQKTGSRIKSGMTDFLPLIVFCLFYLFYFIIIGRSAVKFMRYMLLMYPFFCVLAGLGLDRLCHPERSEGSLAHASTPIRARFFGSRLRMTITATLIITALLWTLAFVNIYSQTHTRISADEWIHKNIPAGSTIAVEHWDDRLPLTGSEYYTIEELTLYDRPDNQYKWIQMNEKLKKADYIVIASNRLYTPLQKLSDCEKYDVCYPLTAQYYKDLFAEKLNFKKVAEFDASPGFKIENLKFKINDESADESFTVYDHPKILIYKKK